MDHTLVEDGITERYSTEALAGRIKAEVHRRVVGQDYMIERLLIGLLTGGHVLFEGVPGLAKTLTVKTLAETIDAAFQRVQFTPDLLPADVVGTTIYNAATGEFVPRPGPIFANVVLADEVNRAPAKVQAALLEAMQERQVTIGGRTFPLPSPFLVLATQNPIEQEGTYPLPEAQVDRFMLKVRVGYPTREDEREILRRMSGGAEIPVRKVAHPDEIMKARRAVAELYLDDRIADYILDLVDATRNPRTHGLAELVPLVEREVRRVEQQCFHRFDVVFVLCSDEALERRAVDLVVLRVLDPLVPDGDRDEGAARILVNLKREAVDAVDVDGTRVEVTVPLRLGEPQEAGA
jgi:MoxR-like ATPase